MIRDALNPPGKTPHDKMPNYDGSNRYVFYNFKENFNHWEKEKYSFMIVLKDVLHSNLLQVNSKDIGKR